MAVFKDTDPVSAPAPSGASPVALPGSVLGLFIKGLIRSSQQKVFERDGKKNPYIRYEIEVNVPQLAILSVNSYGSNGHAPVALGAVGQTVDFPVLAGYDSYKSAVKFTHFTKRHDF